MKGQFVFEFLIAGLIFFAIILYTINYMNVNVSEYKAGFYNERLQSKVVQVSESLTSNRSSLGLVDVWPIFDNSKIYIFEASYCGEEDYNKLLNATDLREPMYFGVKTYNIKINISYINGTGILDCGRVAVPESMQRANIERFGVLNGEIASLKIFVW